LIILSKNQTSKILYAVSFDTVTYRDLQYFLDEDNAVNYRLERIDPDHFVSLSDHALGSYINLVTKDMQLRQRVSEIIEYNNLFRFSLVHKNSYTRAADIGPGCLIYPMVSMYTRATLVNDIIVHSSTMIAHDCYLDTGCYISAGVNIAGTTKLGKFCQIGLAAVIADNITIPNNTIIGMNAMVRKSIVESGVYVNKANDALTKLK